MKVPSIKIFCPECGTKIIELKSIIMGRDKYSGGIPLLITYEVVSSKTVCKECGKEMIFNKKEK
jgi:predicted RNA-binding Zn-ribbon protein involved in translation (DUF1610 family)